MKPANFIDLTGKTFGSLLVVEQGVTRKTSGGQNKTVWICNCICGRQVNIDGPSLKGGQLSCGPCSNYIKGQNQKIHGKTKTKEYRAWRHAKDRCYRINDAKYYLYGERGIKMCEEWISSFETFYKDMGESPFSKASLDRKDVNGDYTPENCRWVDVLVQANNTRSNIREYIDGEYLTLAEIARKFNLNYKSFHHQFRHNKLPLLEAIDRATKLAL